MLRATNAGWGAEPTPPLPGRAEEATTIAPAFKWGADVRLRNDTSVNPSLIDADPPGHSYSFERLRIREWNTFTSAAKNELNLRLTWEGRHYWEPNSKAEWDESEIVFDALNAKVRIPSVPATVVVGRQDMAFGEGWLISDGTPLDGPRTFYFEAVRATVELDRAGSTLDVVYLDQGASPERWLAPLASKGRLLMEQNERGAIAYLKSRPGGATQIDAYLIYKRDRAVVPAGDTGEVYTVGSRLAGDFGEKVSGRLEGAGQFGRRRNAVLFPAQGDGLSAWALNGRVTFTVRDRLKHQLWVGGEVLSGNDAQHSANHQFDPLWGRWAQYSELFPNEFDRPGDRSNVERVNVGYQIEPAAGCSFQANYHALFAYGGRKSGMPGFSAHGNFKGHLATALLRWDLDRFWSGLLLGEYFVPGNYYQGTPNGGPLRTRTDPAAFLRVQLLFTF